MNLDPQEFKRHRDMMASPGEWPRWPVLPVKRPSTNGGFIDTGLMVAIKGREFHVYDANMMQLRNGPLGPQLERFEREEYPDYEGVLDAGWQVD